MAKRLNALVCSVLVVVAALLQSSQAQTTHVVGDTLGWTVPSGGSGTYSTWASAQTFSVNDALVFNYVTGAHDVAKVTAADFNACSSANTISLETTGPTIVNLTTAGEHYYICTVGSHCSSGQKLAVNVSAATTSSPPPSGSSTPPPPPSGSSTPPPPPSGSTTPPPPPPPSSSAPPLAVAALPIAILSIAAALFH